MSDPTSRIDARTLAFREWIAAILQKTGLNPTRLAVAAGLSHSTLSRALKDDDYRINFRADTIAKLVEVGGILPPAALSRAGSAPGSAITPGLSEPDASPAASRDGRDIGPGQSVWTAHSSSLAAMGLLSGDRFILEQGLAPKLRDIVMVQQYDNTTGTAESHLRVWAEGGFAVTPLYLVDGTPRIYVDGINAVLMGVVVESWRTRN